ncbi:hypothetical protein [Agromyces albus]|uniref:hypothetical protein n=1 Tax=Agromyces albus TaxID=205332 RepID=UPI0027886A7A|nr:hypothetical protein [Agromyces albus]MDQ0575893.1 hypothetical protein [Agromyces albus]
MATSTEGDSSVGLRGDRSAAVVSVVSEAATRNAWRWLLAAAAARLRAVDAAAPFSDVARGVRVDFAASPRAAVASADAARDAAVRFEGAGCFVSPSAAAVAAGFLGAGFEAPLRAALDFAAVVPAAVDLAVADFAAVDFAAVDLARFVAAGFVAAGFTSSARTSACSSAACSSAAAFAAADFAAGLAALDFAADLTSAALFVAPDGAGVDEVSAAAPVGDSPVSGTPVPVPSAASSSWLERETEVTKPTYQDGSRNAHSGLIPRSAKLEIP